MFCTMWEFAQSRDCVAHSQNPEIAQSIWRLHIITHVQSRDRVICMSILRTSNFAGLPDSDLLCVARRMEGLPDSE